MTQSYGVYLIAFTWRFGNVCIVVCVAGRFRR